MTHCTHERAKVYCCAREKKENVMKTFEDKKPRVRVWLVFVCVCVCVCERERERGGVTERDNV